MGREGRVVAFEPDVNNFEALRSHPLLAHNVAVNNLSNISLRQCALCDSDDAMVQFYEAPVTSFGMGALVPQFHAEPVTVATRTLDSVLCELGIESVDVLKVDVEGFEAAVFKGAQRLFTAPNPPIVVFEFCNWAEQRSGYTLGEAQRAVASHGYTLWRLKQYPTGPPLDHVITGGSDMLVGVRSASDPTA